MGQITTLVELVAGLDLLDEQATIYAALPWTPHSQAIVEREPDPGGLPAVARDLNLSYFLEVSLATELLHDWVSSLGRAPKVVERCNRLVQYASNDA